MPLKTMKKSKVKRTGRTESDEERGFVMRGAGEPRGTGETGGGGEGLVTRLDKKFCHSNSEVHMHKETAVQFILYS